MSWFREPDLPALLEGERPLLDRIFGEGDYEVQSTHRQKASVRSSRFRMDLRYEARDGSIGSILTITEPWGEESDFPQGWARFLEEEIPGLPRNASGHVTLSPEEQMHAELKCVARLSCAVFADRQKTRDAVNFVRGYRTAYNDWASGAWSPD